MTEPLVRVPTKTPAEASTDTVVKTIQSVEFRLPCRYKEGDTLTDGEAYKLSAYVAETVGHRFRKEVDEAKTAFKEANPGATTLLDPQSIEELQKRIAEAVMQNELKREAARESHPKDPDAALRDSIAIEFIDALLIKAGKKPTGYKKSDKLKLAEKFVFGIPAQQKRFEAEFKRRKAIETSVSDDMLRELESLVEGAR